jgi:hypothetical protein
LEGLQVLPCDDSSTYGVGRSVGLLLLAADVRLITKKEEEEEEEERDVRGGEGLN